MEQLKQIMYGVTDFALMRAENGYFVDRTALIRELEKTRYALFLRPRRFGKSLLCSILQSYYDQKYAHRFEELFGGLDIGRNPTGEQGKYLFIDFNFTGVEKQIDRVQESFNFYCNLRLDKFARDHMSLLPAGVTEVILSCSVCHGKLAALATGLKGSGLKLYICIDEYDNFTNTILAESRENYEALCHGDGFFKQFFNELKLATTGTDAPVTRLFITGVTPVTMDDVTSGFNIAANISMNPAFAAFTGFTHDDLRTMLAYYRAHAGFAFDENAVFNTMRQWYDNYRFAPETDAEGRVVPSVANPTLVFYYMSYFLQNHKPQPELVDRNLRTDYMKIRHIITEGHRINGNYNLLERIVAQFGAQAVVKSSFQAVELSNPENFVSFLFYHGLLAIKGECFGLMELTIPNLSTFLAICDMAYDHYVVHHEQEMGRGFTDIAFEPQLNRWPHIGHAALIELKYLKQDADTSPAALDQIHADAIAQLDRYAADHDLARTWNLTTQDGTVTLHRIVLVFHGGDVALCEEV